MSVNLGIYYAGVYPRTSFSLLTFSRVLTCLQSVASGRTMLYATSGTGIRQSSARSRKLGIHTPVR